MSDGDLPEPFGSHFDAAAAQHGRSADEWHDDIRARVDRIRRRRVALVAITGLAAVLVIAAIAL